MHSITATLTAQEIELHVGRFSECQLVTMADFNSKSYIRMIMGLVAYHFFTFCILVPLSCFIERSILFFIMTSRNVQKEMTRHADMNVVPATIITP